VFFLFARLVCVVCVVPVVKVSDGGKFVSCGVAGVVWDDYVSACGFPVNFEAKVSVVFHDCEVQEVDFFVLFEIHGELEGGCGSVEFFQYLVDVSCRLVEYHQNVVNLSEVADDLVVLKDLVESFVFNVLKVQFRENRGGGGAHG
jgi:hypothetical protein